MQQPQAPYSQPTWVPVSPQRRRRAGTCCRCGGRIRRPARVSAGRPLPGPALHRRGAHVHRGARLRRGWRAPNRSPSRDERRRAGPSQSGPSTTPVSWLPGRSCCSQVPTRSRRNRSWTVSACIWFARTPTNCDTGVRRAEIISACARRSAGERRSGGRAFESRGRRSPTRETEPSGNEDNRLT